MTNGLVVMTPTSVAYSGTSASINADGSVVFSACTSLSLNGVFTSDYDNYMVSLRNTSTSNINMLLRFRVSGADSSSSYTYQRLYANNTSRGGGYNTSSSAFFSYTDAASENALTAYFYGPHLVQPTALRTVTVSSAYIEDYANTHGVSVSYDGFTLFLTYLNFSGLITVFGLNQ
jgi:hypothetical protein